MLLILSKNKRNSRGAPSALPGCSSQLTRGLLVARRRRRRGGGLGHRGLADSRLNRRRRSYQRAVGAPGDVATPGLIPQAPAVIDRVPVAVAAEAIAVALVRAVKAAVVVALTIGLAVAGVALREVLVA